MEDGVALPEDVLIEILVHLPIKSLVRFRCVSKYWCALIKNPNFVSRHLKRDCNGSVLVKRVLPRPPEGLGTKGDGGREVLFFHDPDSLDLLLSPDLPIPQFLDHLVGDVYYHDYMGTCNGLVCLALRGKIILCNPALREFELLPPAPFGCPEGYVVHGGVMGFGYDAITDSYKIVQLLLIVDPEKDYPEIYDDPWLRVDLYNSSTNSWRLIDAGVPRVMLVNDSRFNLFFNGACHWHSDYGDTGGILSLDLGTEVFRHLEFPHFEDEKRAIPGVVNQCLALVRYAGVAYDRELVHIWVMKEYGVKESWTKEFIIGPYAIDYPILLMENEWLLMVTMDGRSASCALHGNEIKRVHFHGNDWYMLAVNFKESLVSLKQVILCGKKD